MKKLFSRPLPLLPVTDRNWSDMPEKVVFCSNCVTSNLRPRIVFDERNVCGACRWAEEKRTKVDWKERERLLVDLLDRHRSKDGRFDVLVPSSGGKDSSYVAYMLKHKYGMNPLTITWTPFLYTDIGWRNYNAMVQSGFDNIFFNPNGIFHRKLSRISFEVNGDNFDPFVYGQKSFAFNIALRFNIPLIFYGENGEVEYGGSEKNKNKPFEDVSDWNELYFKGSGVSRLMDIGKEYGVFSSEELARQDFSMYRPPAAEAIDRAGIQMHWFSFYKNWIPQENYYCAVENTDFETNPERSEGTYTKYSSLDDKTDGYHFYMGFIKYGMGRATRDASMEVRSRHITREEAVLLVQRYDGEFPQKNFAEFLAYLDITEERFHEVVDRFRSPFLWEKQDGQWRLKYRVS